MDNVLTLIASPQKAGSKRSGLSESIISDVRQAIGRIGGETAPPDWLADGEAADIAFSGLGVSVADASARQAVGERPVDVVAQESAQRKKKLLIADMDSTIVTVETLDELADIAGIGDKVAKLTRRAMKGEIGFAEALHERVAMLAGMDEALLEKTWKRVKLTPGAETLVATMRKNGAYTVLISGGFSFFAERVQKNIGFDEVHCNRLAIENGKLTGAVVEPIVDKDAKLSTLTETAARKNLGLDQTLALGDGANDVAMLGAAGLSVAYRAHAIAAAAASTAFEYADLTGVLYAQGYRREEFA